MIDAARALLKEKLSPRTFGRYRYYWWVGRSHATAAAAVFGGHPAPRVQGGDPQLADRIRGAKTFAPSEMCRVMARHGSDKGRFHNYTTVYTELFGDRRQQPLRIFELGLGTNNPALASSMGTSGRPGASMRGWRELFPNALVYGADIDRDILFDDDRIQTFYCDQLDAEAIRDLWSQPELRDKMDILIDDGLHTYEANLSFLNGSLDHVRPGGIYVVEDILTASLPEWRALLKSGFAERFPGFDFSLVELPHPYNTHDNNLLIVHRRGE